MVSTPMTSPTGRGPEDKIRLSPAPTSLESLQGTEEIAAYLAFMTAEMAAMSRGAGYKLLTYFLDMARIEAKIQAEQKKN